MIVPVRVVDAYGAGTVTALHAGQLLAAFDTAPFVRVIHAVITVFHLAEAAAAVNAYVVVPYLGPAHVVAGTAEIFSHIGAAIYAKAAGRAHFYSESFAAQTAVIAKPAVALAAFGAVVAAVLAVPVFLAAFAAFRAVHSHILGADITKTAAAADDLAILTDTAFLAESPAVGFAQAAARTGQVFSAGCCLLVTVRAVFTADLTEFHAVFAAAAVLAVSPSVALTVAAVGTWGILIFSFIEIQLMAVCTDLTATIADIAAVFTAMA
jgi:hypothetical protein